MPRTNWLRYVSAALLVGGWSLGLSPSAQATPALRKELAAAAKEIKQFLEEKKETAIAVGQFTAPAQLAATAGPGLSQMLAEELLHLRVKVEARANFSVEGRYRDLANNTAGTVVQVSLKILDRTDTVVKEVKCKVLGQETVAHVFGLNVMLPAATAAQLRNEKLEQALSNRAAYVDGTRTRVAAAEKSPYALEVLVKKRDAAGDPRAREVATRDGMPFVQIGGGEAFEIRLHNDSDLDAVALLSIDGLQVFSFSRIRKEDGQPKYSRIIVPKKSSIVVKGWHIDNQTLDMFLPTGYPASGLKLATPSNIGSITATFAASWPRGDDPPPDEGARSGAETGLGTRVEQSFREVPRTFGVVRAAVTVRFER